MAKVGIFMADGCEEIEGLAVVDLLRRAGIAIDTISIKEEDCVTGSHRITFKTDVTKFEADFDAYDGIILPGGMPGTLNLGGDDMVQSVLRRFYEEKKLVAAICAAPGVLGEAGLLKGKKAVCYPGFEDKLQGAECSFEPVAVDGNIITSRGMGTVMAFAFEIIRYYLGDAAVETLKEKVIYN